jgi:hypothetical protein
MKKHLQLVFIFVLMGLIPVSCFDDDCEDLPDIQNFEILKISAQRVHEKIQTEILDSTFYPWDSVGIRLEPTEKNYVSTDPSLKQNFSFSSSLYACSPAEPHSIHDLVDIKIISNTEFVRSEFPYDTVKVGENITSLFVLGTGHLLSSARYRSLSETLYSISLGDYASFFLKLQNQPFQNLKLNFNITLTFSNEEEFNFENQKLNLAKG